MASKDNIFAKHLPNIKLTTKLDAEGREIAVEVRKDEEQLGKCQEIIDLLVAAGYFRARIKGLSDFDKIVGGMTWCIEAAEYDVDVDLLFNENLNIKQKISLTEKIVTVVEKMGCPHTIEPHQIQGNDFINIFPVIQWLVKKSVENRTERADKLKRFAIGQFHNEFTLDSDRQQKERNLKILKNLQKVQDTFAPRRQYKRKDAPPDDEKTRVRLTLLEYGDRGVEMTGGRAAAPTGPTVDNSLEGDMQDDEIDVEQLLQALAATQESDDYEAVAELNEAEKAAFQKHYEELKTEMSIDSRQLSEKNQLKVILATKVALEKKLEKVLLQNQEMTSKVEENKVRLAAIDAEKQQLLAEIKDLDTNDPMTDKDGAKVQAMVVENEQLKQKETEFKEKCKKEMAELQQKIQESEDLTPDADIEDLHKVLEKEKNNLLELRLQLAKKNRQCVAVQRQLDNIPDRTELSQYQRRFLELYNQVNAKHRETKQFYTLYNTLEDTKRYLEKEMSILNSIYDNYYESMQTPHSKDQFMIQFEQIVEGIRQTKAKVKAKHDDEKSRRDNLNGQLLTLVEQQRKYAAAIKQFTFECQRNEALHAKLKSLTS